MLVESEDLFADDPEPTTSGRAVSLVRRVSVINGKLIWDIVLDNTNTGAGFTQDAIDIVKSNNNLDTFNKFIELTEDKLSYYQYVLTDDELKEFKNLILALL